jgi:CBS domain-containing protein
MTESKLRSLPVIDAESRVVGMVSRNDLMLAIAPEQR